MRRKKLFGILSMMILIVSVALMNTALGVPAITLSVEPQFVVDPTLVVGTTFTVDIVVTDPTDVMNLYGCDLKLGYDSSVLTATAISFAGNIFEPGYFPWKQEIDDVLGRVWFSVTQELGATDGVNGSGLLATITFTVDAIGDSYLSIYDDELQDPDTVIIPHVVYDGYFRNVELLYFADIVRKSAWPEHHHHVLSKHGNINLLHARFGNKGVRPVTVKVRFTVYNATGELLDYLETDPYNLATGELPADLTVGFDVTELRWEYTPPKAKYPVKAELLYFDVELDQWFEGSKDKWFSFAVVGTFL